MQVVDELLELESLLALDEWQPFIKQMQSVESMNHAANLIIILMCFVVVIFSFIKNKVMQSNSVYNGEADGECQCCYLK